MRCSLVVAAAVALVAAGCASSKAADTTTRMKQVHELRALESEPGEASADDWLAYFSDPKNREDF